MESIVVLCTDGSDVALDGLKQSFPLLAAAGRTIVVTVSTPVDSDLITGNGFATGPTLPELDEESLTSGDLAAKDLLDMTVTELNLVDVETMALVGKPGKAICDLAASLPASVVVIGTHGRSGFRRSLMGSTSDYVVRNAVCPVLVQGAG